MTIPDTCRPSFQNGGNPGTALTSLPPLRPVRGTWPLCAAPYRRSIRPRVSCRINPQLQAFPSLDPFITEEKLMNQIIYIVGAIVIVLFILGFLGLR
jgi:hypothetical protein